MLWGQPSSMFLKERALHAATVYTMTSTAGVCCGGQPAIYVPEGDGAACSHNVHNDLFCRCTLWGNSLCSMFLMEQALHAATTYTVTSTPGLCCGGQPSGPCSCRRGRCMQPQCTQWPLLQVYAVGDSLRSMFLKEMALHAATMYTMTSTLGLCCGGQPSVHVPEGEAMYIMTSTPGLCCGGQPAVNVPEGEGTAVAKDILQPRLAYATKVFLYSVLALLQNCKMLIGVPWETREGWPLLTVETEVNGDSKRTNERGHLSWLVCWACSADTRDFCSALAALAGPVQNIFFLTVHYFNAFVPIPQQQAGQAAVLGCLSFSVCVSGGTLFLLLKLCCFQTW